MPDVTDSGQKVVKAVGRLLMPILLAKEASENGAFLDLFSKLERAMTDGTLFFSMMRVRSQTDTLMQNGRNK